MKNYFCFFILLIISSIHANASIVVVNGLTHTYKIENGKVYKGKIEIENTGSDTQNVKLFLQDLSYSADGSITYSKSNTNKRTNSNWIKLNTNLVSLKAKEKTEVFYEITVSNELKDEGTYWSVIMVEPVEDLSPKNDKFGVSVTSVVRYAIQVITDFKTESAKTDLKFESVKVEKIEGKRNIKIAISNQGNIYCKPTATIEIYNNQTGEKIGSYSSLTMGLLPQTSKSFYIDVNPVTPGKYNAVILATDEEENSFALNIELEINND